MSMSISNVSSYLWPPPPPQPGVTAPTTDGGSSTQSSASGSANAQGTWASDFQQLAADIQAVLVQGQGAANTSATTAASTTAAASTAAAGTASGTSSADPARQLATDLQTIASQLQASNGQSSPTGGPGAAGQGEPHHHHHHHHHGGGSEAASSATSSGSSSSGSSASNDIQNVATTLAADIMQALRSYGSSATSTTTPGLVA